MLVEMRESDGKKQKAKGAGKADASRKLHGLVQQRMERTFGATTPSNKAPPSPRLSPSHPLVVRHPQFQNAIHGNTPDDHPNQMPYEVLLRHHYPTVSALLESAEKQDVSEWADWSESKRIFLPVLLSLWKQLGRPEIKWPTMPHLPPLDVCSCVLQSYWIGMGWAKMPNLWIEQKIFCLSGFALASGGKA